jgi:hypothetical protein
MGRDRFIYYHSCFHAVQYWRKSIGLFSLQSERTEALVRSLLQHPHRKQFPESVYTFNIPKFGLYYFQKSPGGRASRSRYVGTGRTWLPDSP